MTPKHTERALQVLRATNRALEKSTEEQELLNEICQIITDVGGYRFTWVGYARDDADKSVEFVASAGYHQDYLKEIRIGWGDTPIGQGPAGIAIKTSTAYVVRNVHNNPDFKVWRDTAIKYGYESAIALPLSWREQTFGCLVILSEEADAFDTGEAGLLGELAAALSYGINALRANLQRDLSEAELRTERDTQGVLRKILSLSLEQIPLEAKLDRVLELLFSIPWLALEHKGSVFLADENSDKLLLVSKKYLSPVLAQKCATVDFGKCLCGKAASTRELVFHSHVTHDQEVRMDGMQDHGHYCQPILSSRGLLGVLNLYVAAGHVPKPVEQPFLSAVADTLAGIIELEQTKMAQQRLIAILDATPDLVTITDSEGKFLYCNNGARNMFGTAGNPDPPDKSVSSHYPEEIARLFMEQAYPYARKTGAWEGELLLDGADGGQLPVSQLVIAHRDVAGGEIAYYSTIARDIRDRKRAELAAQAAALSEKNFANILINSLPGIFFLINENGCLKRWNSNFEQALGYSAGQLQNMALSQLVVAEDQLKLDKFCNDARTQGTASVEIELQKMAGGGIPFFINGAIIEVSDRGASIVGTGIDISYRLQLEQELRARAVIDTMTGAFNRFKMEDAINYEIQKYGRHPMPLSIAMFDIDHFKGVNDTYGHGVGDVVIKRVVELARQQLRDSDLLARWGGEEFMVLAGSTDLDAMYNVAERVRLAIAEQDIDPVGNVTVSLGVGQYRAGESQKSLLKRVDDALYAAKKAGRNQTQIAQ